MKVKNNDLMVPMEMESDSEEDIAHFKFTGMGRLILGTKHGTIIIDIRTKDVNSFVIKKGLRIDNLLIAK